MAVALSVEAFGVVVAVVVAGFVVRAAVVASVAGADLRVFATLTAASAVAAAAAEAMTLGIVAIG